VVSAVSILHKPQLQQRNSLFILDVKSFQQPFSMVSFVSHFAYLLDILGHYVRRHLLQGLSLLNPRVHDIHSRDIVNTVLFCCFNRSKPFCYAVFWGSSVQLLKRDPGIDDIF